MKLLRTLALALVILVVATDRREASAIFQLARFVERAADELQRLCYWVRPGRWPASGTESIAGNTAGNSHHPTQSKPSIHAA